MRVTGGGAQKLFGAFGGRGLEAAGAGFERVGLTPGRSMARLAGTSELVGGLLAAAGPGRYSLNTALGLRVPRPLVRLAVPAPPSPAARQ